MRGGIVTSHMLRIGQSVSFGIFSTDGASGVDLDGDGMDVSTDGDTHHSSFSSAQIPPQSRYQWTHEGVDIFSIRDDGRQLKPYFILENVSALDAGHYRCFKLSDLGRRHLVAESIIEISTPPAVLDKGVSDSGLQSPSSSKQQVPIVLKRGNSFFLELESAGYPRPSYHWLKNGYPIPADSTLSIAEDIFSIDKAGVHHSGSYSCELSNLAGKTLWRGLDLIVTE